jgi:hypothetical protein
VNEKFRGARKCRIGGGTLAVELAFTPESKQGNYEEDARRRFIKRAIKLMEWSCGQRKYPAYCDLVKENQKTTGKTLHRY